MKRFNKRNNTNIIRAALDNLKFDILFACDQAPLYMRFIDLFNFLISWESHLNDLEKNWGLNIKELRQDYIDLVQKAVTDYQTIFEENDWGQDISQICKEHDALITKILAKHLLKSKQTNTEDNTLLYFYDIAGLNKSTKKRKRTDDNDSEFHSNVNQTQSTVEQDEDEVPLKNRREERRLRTMTTEKTSTDAKNISVVQVSPAEVTQPQQNNNIVSQNSNHLLFQQKSNESKEANYFKLGIKKLINVLFRVGLYNHHLSYILCEIAIAHVQAIDSKRIHPESKENSLAVITRGLFEKALAIDNNNKKASAELHNFLKTHFKSNAAQEASNARIKDYVANCKHFGSQVFFFKIIKDYILAINNLFKDQANGIFASASERMSKSDFIAQLKVTNTKAMEIESIFKDTTRLQRATSIKLQ